jgi:hypothetical protein
MAWHVVIRLLCSDKFNTNRSMERIKSLDLTNNITFVSDQRESSDNREISYPSIVDSRGQHISYDIHELPGPEATVDTRTYFKLEAFGKKYLLNVTSSSHFVHDTQNDVPVVEYIRADGTSRATTMNHSRDCFHSGHVHLMGDLDTSTNTVREVPLDGWVTMSSCLGLVSGHA